MLPWMEHYRPMLTAGRPFDLTEHLYLKAIYADQHQEVVYKKAAQVGVSEYLISWTLYQAAERDATGLYVMPSGSSVSDFSAARLGPAVDSTISPRLAELITPASSGRKGARGSDRITLKRVRNRFVYFRSGHISERNDKENVAQLKSIDADVLILDELDEMDARVPPIARQRLLHSNIAKVRQASTPTYAGLGIDVEYQASDQRQWFLPCPHCNHEQTLDLDNLIQEYDSLDRPIRWYGKGDGQDEFGRPYLGCRQCGKMLDRTAPGVWVPAYPGRAVHGYHITGLMSVRKPLKLFIQGLLSTDETKRRETTNQTAGEAYRPRESENLSEQTLNACRREYALGPVPGEKTVAGVDVGRVLNMVVRGVLPDGNRALRFAGQLDSFEEVLHIMTRFNVGVCVMDALPETRKARELQKKKPRLAFWLAYFTNFTQGAKTERASHYNAKELEVDIDRTRAMDDTLALFHNATLHDENGWPLPGNTLPETAPGIPDYYTQMKAPTRIMTEDSKGNRIPAYISAGKDHYAFAELYCATAVACPYQGWSRGAG